MTTKFKIIVIGVTSIFEITPEKPTTDVSANKCSNSLLINPSNLEMIDIKTH